MVNKHHKVTEGIAISKEFSALLMYSHLSAVLQSGIEMEFYITNQHNTVHCRNVRFTLRVQYERSLNYAYNAEHQRF